MKATEKRIAALEKLRHYRAGDVGCVIHLKRDESLEEACKRLGLADASGRIVMNETMSCEEWDKTAWVQQAALVRECDLTNSTV